MMRFPAILAVLLLLALLSGVASAQTTAPTKPSVAMSGGVTVDRGDNTGLDVRISGPLQIMLLLTLISFLPSIVVMMTSFTRVVVVLGFLRNALGTQQIPPTPVLVGLAMFLTFFIMRPVLVEVNDEALKPYMDGKIEMAEAAQRAVGPIRVWMFKQVRKEDVALFVELSGTKRPETLADIPTHVLVPAFTISELRRAFEIGFILYVPCLIIDMVISSALLSMGMMMLPPMMLSVPFKLLLFVLVDGWGMLVGNLARGFVT
jgi:flagellar biosynthesis protein FliP